MAAATKFNAIKMMPHTSMPMREMNIVRQRLICLGNLPNSASCRPMITIGPLEHRQNMPRGGTVASAAKKGDDRRRPPPKKGFGTPSSESLPPERAMRQFEDDDSVDGEDGAQEDFESRPQYQIYSDSDYKPKRFIGKVEIAAIHGGEAATWLTYKIGIRFAWPWLRRAHYMHGVPAWHSPCGHHIRLFPR